MSRRTDFSSPVLMYGAPPDDRPLVPTVAPLPVAPWTAPVGLPSSLAEQMRAIVSAKVESDRAASLALYMPAIREAAERGESSIVLRDLTEPHEQFLRGAGFYVEVAGNLDGRPNMWRVSW